MLFSKLNEHSLTASQTKRALTDWFTDQRSTHWLLGEMFNEENVSDGVSLLQQHFLQVLRLGFQNSHMLATSTHKHVTTHMHKHKHTTVVQLVPKHTRMLRYRYQLLNSKHTWAQAEKMLSISFSMFVHSVALNAAAFPTVGKLALPGPPAPTQPRIHAIY